MIDYFLNGREVFRDEFHMRCHIDVLMHRDLWRRKFDFINSEITHLINIPASDTKHGFPYFSDSEKEEIQQKITKLSENLFLFESFMDKKIEQDFDNTEKRDLQTRLWDALSELVSEAYHLGRLNTKPKTQDGFYTGAKRVGNAYKTNEKQKSNASCWHEAGLKKAKELRQNEPSLSQDDLAFKIMEELNLEISVRTIVLQISKWEKNGDLPKKLPQTASGGVRQA